MRDITFPLKRECLISIDRVVADVEVVEVLRIEN